MRFVLDGEVACKKNSVRFNGRTGMCYKSKRFKSWHESAILQVRSQEVPRTPIERYEARFTLYHGTLRRVDSDNQVTSLLDLLQDAGVVKDDCWTCVSKKVIEDVYRKNDPGAVIEILPVDF